MTNLKMAVAVLSLGLATAVSHAAPILWTGGGDDVTWTDGANWAGGTAPAFNAYTDQGAEFNGGATTITITSGQLVSGVKFDTAGWTLSSVSLSPIASNGAGTNTITGQVNYYANGSDANGYTDLATWSVGPGNTLAIGSVYFNNHTLKLDGGGTVSLTSAIAGNSGHANSINIYNATLQIAATTLYASSDSDGVITLENVGQSFIDLKTTATNTETYFGTEIQGVGGTLQATDLGNGYTQVSLESASVPEPASLALLGLGGLMLIRRRKSAR